jgi:hypothetical protein
MTTETEEIFVDQEARDKIERLERRLEGAHLTPGIWVMSKQALQSILQWKGWEVFGIGVFIAIALTLIAVGIFSINYNIWTLDQEEHSATCQALDMTFSVESNGKVTCVGADRVIRIDPYDIDETEVFLINGE